MRYARPVTCAALLLVGQAGCRTAGIDNLARRAPAVARPQLDARTLITEHNRNAERIEKISAKPSLSVWKGRRPGGAADGRLALERPRNFRLEVASAAGDVADIGSNDEKFWYWIKDNPDKAVYYCQYDESGRTPLSPAVLQPEWIVEALGLRVITEDEAAGCTVTRAKEPDTLVLTHPPIRTGGETVTRVTVLKESNHRIKEHRLLAGDGKSLIARAIIEDYLTLPDGNHPDETVFLPRKMRIEWARDRMTLDVSFAEDSTKINAEFPADKYAALFVEDPRHGYDRLDLAKLANLAPAPKPQQGPTTLRETLPAPPAGVQLGEPAPMGIDGAMRTDRDPVAISSSRTSLRDGLLGPALPTAPGPAYAKPEVSSRWRASNSSFER